MPALPRRAGVVAPCSCTLDACPAMLVAASLSFGWDAIGGAEENAEAGEHDVRNNLNILHCHLRQVRPVAISRWQPFDTSRHIHRNLDVVIPVGR